jgi:hypothetical protein
MASGSNGHVEEGCRTTHFSTLRISRQTSAEHFEQCAEFPLLPNRGLGRLAVTVLPIALARRAAGKRRTLDAPPVARACFAGERRGGWFHTSRVEPRPRGEYQELAD